MIKNKLIRLQSSKYRCLELDFKHQNTFNQLITLIEKILNNRFDLYSKKDLKSLDTDELQKLSYKINNNYQSKLRKILKNDVDDFCIKFFGKKFPKFRIGVQIKSKWKQTKNLRKNKGFYNKNGVFCESKYKPNICFQTRPHQDLNNNGFRSSSVIIFYIPITPNFTDSSLLQITKLNKKVSLYDFGNVSGYHNEIKKNVSKKLNWEIPKKLKHGKIFLMDSFTAHKSSSISNTPRIALNIKIQPTNLNYVFLNYKFKKKKNLKYLIMILKKLSRNINSFNFELSVAQYLFGDYKSSKENLIKIFNFKPSITLLKKVMAGAFLKKDLKMLKNDDYKNIFKKKIKIEKYSCAESIIKTLK